MPADASDRPLTTSRRPPARRCTFCREAAVDVIPYEPPHVCRHHAAEFWRQLLAANRERPWMTAEAQAAIQAQAMTVEEQLAQAVVASLEERLDNAVATMRSSARSRTGGPPTTSWVKQMTPRRRWRSRDMADRAKHTADSARAIREKYHAANGTLTFADLAREFGGSPMTISLIVKGKLWPKAGGPIDTSLKPRFGRKAPPVEPAA